MARLHKVIKLTRNLQSLDFGIKCVLKTGENGIMTNRGIRELTSEAHTPP
jgi:hypothetical protein